VIHLITVRRFGLVLFASLVACFSNQVNAQQMTLTQALELARNNDPQYLGARAQLEATRERAAQARAYSLPQISIRGANNSYNRRYETLDTLFPVPISETRYQGYSAQLTLNQPLWRHANAIGRSQASSAIDQGMHEVLAAEQDLLLRVASAWFDTMSAADSLAHVEARRAATHLQWDQVQKAAAIHLAAGPALEETRAEFERASAEQVAAAYDVEAKRAALEEIVGVLPAFVLPTLSPNYVPPAPEGQSLEHWLELAENNSPTVRAARAALDVADAEIRRQRAAREPTLDLVGSVGINNQGEGDFPTQPGYNVRQKSIGIELNVPIYQGGMQGARVREAVAMRSRAEQDLQQALRDVHSATKAAWFGWQGNNARYLAASHGVTSATLAVRSASVGKAQGVNFELEVLEANEQLLDAWRGLQQARYETILASMRLKAVGGQLSNFDFVALDSSWVPRDTATRQLTALNR
jgi:outer membrane protein